MRVYLLNWLIAENLPHSAWVVNIIMLALIALTTIVLHFILHYGLFYWVGNYMKRSKLLFLNILAEKKLFNNLVLSIQGVLLALQLRIWMPESEWRDGFMSIGYLWGWFFLLLTLFSLFDTIQSYLFRKNLAQQFPIRGLVQTAKLATSIGIGIIMVSLIIGRSPLILISGLGAMTAVLMLVFKDPILGLVAGIQLSANKMLNIGDWLEMPKYNADGSVVDIGLTTVKVQNWDNTITTLPTYALISDSFKNWQAMTESGGRRIKRSVCIDSASVHFLSEDEINHLRQSQLLTTYLDTREQEIKQFNQSHGIENDTPLNGRHLTNLGTFRAYLNEYLQHNEHIRKDMTLMVRQLEPVSEGVPLEVYCFTNTVDWVAYESIQADLFDHIFAIAPEFNLRIFQSPSGQDFQQFVSQVSNNKAV